MLYLLDLIDYWRDQMDAARERHDRQRALVCGHMLWALGARKAELHRFN